MKLKFTAIPAQTEHLERTIHQKSTPDLEAMKVALELVAEQFKTEEDYFRLALVEDELHWRYSAGKK